MTSFIPSTILSNTLLAAPPSTSDITIPETGTYLISAQQYTCTGGSNTYAQVRIVVNGINMGQGVSYPNSCDSSFVEVFLPINAGSVVSGQCLHLGGSSTNCSLTIVRL